MKIRKVIMKTRSAKNKSSLYLYIGEQNANLQNNKFN